MIFHGILSIRRNIKGALAFILVTSALSAACYRVPEPTSSTRANELTPDDESQMRNPSSVESGPETNPVINREDPNLAHDFIGTESGVTTEPSETSQTVDDQFRPESDEEEDETGDRRGKKQAP